MEKGVNRWTISNAGETSRWQHQMKVYTMTLETKKGKRMKVEPMIKWWTLKE